jgi:outer membrane protein insertion porin family
MKKFAGVLFFCLLICGFVVLPVFSQNNDEWYLGKVIKDVTFTGIVNVKIKELHAITDPYKGQIFSEDIGWELQGKLYALEYFEKLQAKAIRAGQRDSDGLIISFDVTEKALVSEFIFEGNDFLSKDRLSAFLKSKGYEENKNIFFSPASIREIQGTIEEAYEECGFRQVKTETTETQKDDKTYALTFHINEGYQNFVEDVQFAGNTAFSDSELRQYLVTHSTGVCNTGLVREAETNEDIKALVKYYTDSGYEMTIKTHPDIRESRSEGNMRFLTVTYTITKESEQHFFGGFEFSGNRAFSNAQLSALVQSRIGEAYNTSLVRNDIQRIYDIYHDAGYLNVVILTEEKRESYVLSYRLDIDEKDKVYVADIIVRGNRKYTTEAILEQIPLKPGDVFSPIKTREARSNLAAMNITVNFEVEMSGRSDRQILIINIEER